LKHFKKIVPTAGMVVALARLLPIYSGLDAVKRLIANDNVGDLIWYSPVWAQDMEGNARIKRLVLILYEAPRG